MLDNLVYKKVDGKELTREEFKFATEYLVKNGMDANSRKFFYCLNSFGLSKKEVLYLTLAIRDSGKVLKFKDDIMEKHSTGGIGDSTSVVLIPLLASLGYRIIKTTAKSFVFTNGSEDRFGAIPGFRVKLSSEEIRKTLKETNACVLAHGGDLCPADKILFKFREENGIESDINFTAASIAAKKLSSGAKIVFVDVKYGDASVIKTYSKAVKVANLLKYIFDECEIKSTIVITNTLQTIGEGIGNAVEVLDAIDVLNGKHCLLRDVSVEFAVEMIKLAKPDADEDEIKLSVEKALDDGSAFKTFENLVKMQGGKEKLLKNGKIFKPYKTINFVSDRDGYVGSINSLLLGELVRRMCKETHDNNLGVKLCVKIGDQVKKGDTIITYYYKDDADLKKYRSAISGCVGITGEEIEPVGVIRKVIR